MMAYELTIIFGLIGGRVKTGILVSGERCFYL